jgi:putative oxidoreductase
MTLDQQVTLRSWAVVPLRVVVGIGFVVHGYAKLSRGPAGFAKLLAHIGVPFPLPTAWAVTGIELLGGLALIAGVGVVIVSLPLIASMAVAMIQVQSRYGFSSVQTIGLTADGPVFGPPGYEINLLYIAALLLIAIVGPGPLSLKSWIASRSS